MPTLPAGLGRPFGVISKIAGFMFDTTGTMPGTAAMAMLPALAAGLGRFFPIPGKVTRIMAGPATATTVGRAHEGRMMFFAQDHGMLL